MRGKKPIVLIFLAITIIVGVIQYRMDVRSANLKGFEIVLVERERDVRLLSSLTESVIRLSRTDVLEGHLNDAVKIGWIDFYLLTFEGEPVLYNSVRPLSEQAYSTILATHPPDAFWEFSSTFEQAPSLRGSASKNIDVIEDFRFVETDLGEGRRLKLGFNTNREAFLAEMTAKVASENQRILVWGILLSLATFLFAARDLFKIVRVVRSRGVQGLSEMTSISKEAEVLAQGLRGYESTVRKLTTENRKLGAQVLPSLRSELQSDRKPPYDFMCTMVRTDINSFTQIFHQHPREEFLGTINEFFTECSHVISRYNGLIHEFVGDEIIFYLKDENHVNSFTAALSCVREISAVAEAIHERTTSKNGYAFRIKSSVSHGSIRFGKLLNGYSLAGAPLIETTRILSNVSEKNENTIHFDSSNLGRLSSAVEFVEGFQAHLKGMEGERRILRYVGHRKQEVVIATKDFSSVHEYRDDRSLVNWIHHAVNHPTDEVVPGILHLLSVTRVTKCSTEYPTHLLEKLRLLNEKAFAPGSENFPEYAKVVASIVAALPRLLPSTSFDRGLAEFLERMLEFKDARVVANTVESMQAFRDTGFTKLNRKLLDSTNARVAANAIVFMGRTEITKDVVKRTAMLLDSKDPVLAGAGIYVWGEIAGHYAVHDPVYLRTQTDFQKQSEKFRAISKRHPTLRRLIEGAERKSRDDSPSQAS